MTVVNRLVVLLPGFEHMPVEAHHRRFMREAAKTAPVYDMSIDRDWLHSDVPSPMHEVATGQFSLHTSGEDWSAKTDFILYGLGDITLFYASRNPLVRLLSGIVALLDFIVTGNILPLCCDKLALCPVFPLPAADAARSHPCRVLRCWPFRRVQPDRDGSISSADRRARDCRHCCSGSPPQNALVAAHG